MGDVSVITTIFTIISWFSIFAIAYFTYKKLQEKPAFWKVLVVTFIGILAFTVNLEVFGSWIRLPILPLGVWILMVFFIGKKGDGKCIVPLLGLDLRVNLFSLHFFVDYSTQPSRLPGRSTLYIHSECRSCFSHLNPPIC